MAFDYAGLRQDVEDILADLGRDVTYSVVTPGAYDPATSAAAEPAPTNYTVLAVDGDIGGRKFEQGSMVRMGDRIVTMAAQRSGVAITFTPKAQDRMTIDGRAYTVINVLDEIKPGGVLVAVVLQVRR